MKEKTAKGFKLPKIRKQESKDNLRHLDVKGRDCHEVLNIVRRTYINTNIEPAWKLKSAALVENRELEERYRSKKAEMKEEGRPARDIADHFAVMIPREKENSFIQSVVKQGLRCRAQAYNGLGDSKSGVYLWRYADIQLRMAETWSTSTCTMMVFKIMLGKCKSIPPQTGSETAVIEPTPNYDCHIPQNVARPSDSLGILIARSQVYLYEYTEDCEPTAIPRQCLPYAVLVYEKMENTVNKLLSMPSNRYSVRPSDIKRTETSSDSDQRKVADKQDAKVSAYDPTPELLDSRPHATYSADTGLCVPRLTSGLPSQRDLPLAVVSGAVPLTDPRSQLSFLASEGPLRQLPGVDYQPSFGPSDDEEEQGVVFDLSDLLKKPKMPSLPPIELPMITDTRQLQDPRFEKRFADPRVEKKAQESDLEGPKDPRLYRCKDPRLNRSQDPRLNRPSKSDNKPRHPRIHNDKANMSSRDPRLSNREHALERNKIDDDSSRVKKKLSLHEYKKKVHTEQPETVSLQSQNTAAIPDVVTDEEDEFLEDLDLRQHIPQPTPHEFHEPLAPHHANIIMNPNVNAIRHPQLQNVEPSFSPETPDTSSMVASEVASVDSEQHDDVVNDPDDMAKALNELSDPDDESRSPKHTPEPDMPDPVLAEAMKKLVEHSENVNLFTDALKSLQDSAEEYGDQLHNPEFLVKKIAEEIERVNAKQREEEKMKAEKLEKERLEAERLEREKLEQERLEAERIAREKMEKERLEAERLAREKLERERLETERLEREKLERERLEAERQAKENIEKQRLQAEQLAKERMQAEIERQRIIAEMTNLQSEPEVQMTEDDIDEIKSPDCIMSPDRTDNENYETQQTVKSIPLESTEAGSVLEEAMKKTLEELEKVEEKGSSQTELVNASKDTSNFNLVSIPLPEISLKTNAPEISKDAFKQQSEVVSTAQSAFMAHKGAPPTVQVKEMKDKVEVVPMELDSEAEDDGEEDIDLRSGFPAHPHILPDFKSRETLQKPQIKINLKLTSKKRSVSKDEDLRSRSESKLIESSDHKLGKNNKSDSSGSTDHISVEGEKKKSFDMFEESVDERPVVSNIKDKAIFQHDSFKAVSFNEQESNFSDPFGLGTTEDVDERVTLNKSEKNTVQRPMRDFSDVDLRTSAESSQQDTPVDYDFRKSHSRSASPTRKISANTSEDHVLSVQLESSKQALDKSDNIYNYTLSQDSSSSEGSSILFDAYSIGKKKDTENLHSNDFGDVDWRFQASNDFDMRTDNSGQGHSFQPYPKSARSNETFSQVNKSIQNTVSSIYEARNNVPYSTFVFQASERKGNYSTTSSQINQQSQPNSQFHGVQNLMQNLDFSNLRNILARVQQAEPGASKQVDSSLSNNVATVDSDGNDIKDFRQNDDGVKNEEDLSEPLPMIPGFGDIPGYNIFSPVSSSDSGSKAGKECGKDGVKVSKTDLGDSKSTSFEGERKRKIDKSGDFESELSKKQSESCGQNDLGKKDKRLSELEHEIQSVQKDRTKIPSTPKDKIRYDDDLDQEMTPLPNISYQSALLESIEQSALKVRSEDCATSDIRDDTPIKNEAKPKSVIQHDLRSDNKYSPTENSFKQRKRSNQDMESIPVSKVPKRDRIGVVAEIDDDDDDDDGGGLVIDLSPGEKSTDQVPMVSPVADKCETPKPNSITEHTDEKPVVDENEAGGVKDETSYSLDVLREKEDETAPKSKDEMTSMIEKSRKNMVIKLKGETKKVNPKTGKMYVESPRGSAIEVLGRPNRPSANKISNRNQPSKCRSRSPLDQPLVLPISTITSGIVRATSPVNFGSSANKSPQATVSRVSSPMLHTVSSAIPTVGTGQHRRPSQTNTYIHPLTGQPIQYGNNPPGQQPHPIHYSQGGINPSLSSPGQVPVIGLESLPGTGPVPGRGFLPALPIVYGNQQSAFAQTSYGMSQMTTTQSDIYPPGQEVCNSGVQTNVQMGGQQPAMPIQTVGQQANNTIEVLPAMKSEILQEYPNSDSVPDKISKDTKKAEKMSRDRIKVVTQIKLEPKTPNKKKRQNSDIEDGSEIKKTKTEPNIKQQNSESKVKDVTCEFDSKRKGGSETNRKLNEFGSRILETLSEVKSAINTTKEEVKVSKNNSDETGSKAVAKEEAAPIVIASDESELEDGEISDDSDTGYVANSAKDHRDVQASAYGVGGRFSSHNRNSAPSYYEPSYSNFQEKYTSPVKTVGSNRYRGAKNIGADWTDIIQNPSVRAEERIRATNIESPSLRMAGSGASSNEESDLLTKSIASISKSKQKFVAQSKVKTLGEWLKVELETDNIKPLESIIPYSLDTDLSVISKTKRRKIRLRVKTVIEQEGLKRAKEEKEKAAVSSVVKLIETIPKPPVTSIHPSYSPEVHNDELERELHILRNAVGTVTERVMWAERNPGKGQVDGSLMDERRRLLNDKNLLVAMNLVESEMKQLLLRPCFFGYPHRRVPAELLLTTELNTFKSEGDVFLILMMPISNKPYQKLLRFKQNIERLYAEKETSTFPNALANLENQIQIQKNCRQSLLRSFTGYLNKKRIQKIQETVDKYTVVYDYFKSQKPPAPESALKHIRTTQMDLRQHLILARQYMAMEEMKKS